MFRIEELEITSADLSSFYKEGKLEAGLDLPTNSYLVLRAPSGTAIARVNGAGDLVSLGDLKLTEINGISPKDAAQRVFMDALLSQKTLVNVCIGSAGTGKSTIALAYALHEFMGQRKKIFLTKPTATVGRGNAFGPVPGDVDQKYRPFLGSYEIIFEKMMGNKGKDWLDVTVQRGDIRFIPIEFVRGCTFDNCTFIIDEAQNLAWHELNTIISRMGENTKLIILGDVNQIDIKLPMHETGLWKFIHSTAFKNSSLTSAIELTKQYRSPITQLVAEVDTELRNEETDGSTRNRKSVRRAPRLAS